MPRPPRALRLPSTRHHSGQPRHQYARPRKGPSGTGKGHRFPHDGKPGSIAEQWFQAFSRVQGAAPPAGAWGGAPLASGRGGTPTLTKSEPDATSRRGKGAGGGPAIVSDGYLSRGSGGNHSPRPPEAKTGVWQQPGTPLSRGARPCGRMPHPPFIDIANFCG